MSRIVQVVNAMLQRPENISNVIKSDVSADIEYYFLYKSYKWSIFHDKEHDNFYLTYYPSQESLDALANLTPPEFQGVPILVYKTKELGTKEAYDSFRELYSSIQERVYNINSVFDDILKE